MTFGAHLAAGQDLRHGVLRGRALLQLIDTAERCNVVERVVVADVLERILDAPDQVFLLDDGHVRTP
jgi:hypothetical protein